MTSKPPYQHPPSGIWDFLFNRIGKEGIFAILFVITLGIILWGSWNLALFVKDEGHDYLESQKLVMRSLADANSANSEATTQIADAVTKLVGFHDAVAAQHESMIEGINIMVSHIDEDESRDGVAAAKLDKLIELMTEANRLMQDVPGQRIAELDLLRKIEAGIKELRECMVPVPDDTPPE